MVGVVLYLWPKDRNRINVIYGVSVIFYLWPKDRNVCVCVRERERERGLNILYINR